MMILGFVGVGFMAYRRKSKSAFDTRLIHDHRIYIQEPPSGGFSIGNRADVTSVIGAFPTGAGLQADTGLRSEFVG